MRPRTRRRPSLFCR